MPKPSPHQHTDRLIEIYRRSGLSVELAKALEDLTERTDYVGRLQKRLRWHAQKEKKEQP